MSEAHGIQAYRVHGRKCSQCIEEMRREAWDRDRERAKRMKIKITTSVEGLRSAMRREVEGQMKPVMADAVTKIMRARHQVESDALIDAVERQIAAWENQ